MTLRHHFQPENNVCLSRVCGPLDAHLRRIEAGLGVTIARRGAQFSIDGPKAAAAQALEVLGQLYREASERPIYEQEVELAVREAAASLAEASRGVDLAPRGVDPVAETLPSTGGGPSNNAKVKGRARAAADSAAEDGHHALPEPVAKVPVPGRTSAVSSASTVAPVQAAASAATGGAPVVGAAAPTSWTVVPDIGADRGRRSRTRAAEAKHSVLPESSGAPGGGGRDAALAPDGAAAGPSSAVAIEPTSPPGPPQLHTRRADLRGRTPNQVRYIQHMLNTDITFGIGPAGTGKTYLAVACAVDALERHAVQRLVLTRPAVEAGERLGFLPGDLAQKVDPYLRPLYDALYDLMGFDRVTKAFEKGLIEIAPLAFMRGRTLNHAFVILDEAQNTTREQMKMFLTRIGFGSRCVVTGDVSQIDLPAGTRSGLVDAEQVLAQVTGIAFSRFGPADVVRHPLVARIVEAYDAARGKP